MWKQVAAALLTLGASIVPLVESKDVFAHMIVSFSRLLATLWIMTRDTKLGDGRSMRVVVSLRGRPSPTPLPH